MARVFLTAVNLSKNELQNARIQNLASAPSSPATGQVYIDTGDANRLKYWNGSAWIYADSQDAPQLASTSPTTIQPDDSAAVGVGTTSARADHKHAIVAATAGSSAVGDSAAEGSSTSFARADHAHGREAFGAVTAQTSFGASSGNGSATTLARSDHVHGTPAHGDAAHSAVSLTALAAPTADLSLNSHKITNLTDPTSAQDAATKAYVDATSQGLDVKPSVKAVAIADVTLSGAQTIDGYSAVATNRVLLTGQTDPAENGIWVVAAGSWTRPTDFDAVGDVTEGAFTFVEEGTSYEASGWVLAELAGTFPSNTTQTWSQFSGAGQITAGAGLTKTGNTLDVGQGNGIVVNANDVAVSYYGSNPAALGAASAGASNSVSRGDHVHPTTGIVAKYATDVGDGAATAYVITHSLNTRDALVQVHESATPWAVVEPDIEMTSVNTVTLRFTVAPTSNQYRVTVVG